MDKTKDTENETQAPVDGIILGHELTEQGTKLVILVGEMESVPRRVKMVW